MCLFQIWFYLQFFFELKQIPFGFITRQNKTTRGRLCRWIQGPCPHSQDSWISRAYLYRLQIWLFRLLALITSRFQWKRIGPQQNDGSWDLRQQNIKQNQKSQPWMNSCQIMLPLAAIWRRKWQPIPVFLPGESQGQQSLAGCRLWGRTESDTTEAT